jgi:hypothetical protein
MLKIKDDVDLQELEKFGFKEHFWENTKTETEIYINSKNEISVCKEKIFDELDICGNTILTEINDLDTLYDLIKADLVEKI